MPETGKTQNQSRARHQIPVWCARFNTDQFQEADLMHLDENCLVLLSDVPFRPRTALFIRMRSVHADGYDLPFSAAIRTVGIAEVKWCRKSERSSGGFYEMGVCYLEPLA